MENKDNITRLIDYLYGNLTQKEKDAFEEKLKADPELRKELDDLLIARKGLGSLGDQEVMDPYVFQAGQNRSLWNNPVNRPVSIALRYVVAIAASLFIFLSIGYFTRASVQFGKGSVTLSFGERDNSEKPLTRAEIAGMINDRISGSNKQMAEQIKSSETAFQQILDDHHKKEAAELRQLLASYTHAKNDEIELALNRMQKDNRALVDEYVKQSSMQQQLYMQNLVAGFSDYLQKQRNEDLEKIRTSLVALKQSQDNQKMETSQILTSIISTLNTQNN